MKKERLTQSCIERIKIYITIKDLYLRFQKGGVFFFWSLVFLILYFERKGDNLHRIGLLLFSYHWFLYQEIVIIFSQSCITSGPEDWDVTVSDSFRDIKNISHLEINPNVENPSKTFGTAAAQNMGVRRARGLGCISIPNVIFKMRVDEKGATATLNWFPHAELMVMPFF